MRLHTSLALASLLIGAGASAQAQPISPALTGVQRLAQDPDLLASLGDPGIPPGYIIVDGDIQVRLESFLLDGGAIGTVNFWWGSGFWNNVVPYEFDADFTSPGPGQPAPGVTAANQTHAIDAMNRVAAVANIQFRVKQAGDGSWIHFRNSTGNNSPAGRQGGQQNINIASWNNDFIIAHEIIHSLGWVHEQSRTDRDTYVIIQPCNSQGVTCNGQGQVITQGPPFTNNFLIESTNAWGPYDFDSVMHYDRCAFSSACPAGTSCPCPPGTETIIVRPPWNTQWQNIIGQRGHLSYIDGWALRGVYPYSGDRWFDNTWGGSQDGLTLFRPLNTSFANAVATTPSGGTMVLYGSYSAIGTYSKPMTIQAPRGNVTLGN